jgi:phosphoribosylformylglycinamidine cyclo-ligase
MKSPSYESAGVNVELGDRFVERLKSFSRRDGHQKLLKGAGGYAAVYPVTDNRYIALTTDGVGTKVLLAHQFNDHHGVGIDLVAMCANDLICVGARPTLFLDYFATGKLDLDLGVRLIEGIVEGCDQSGMILVGGETAEMPDVYTQSHYDLAGFALGELSKNQLITGEKIQPGQKIIGLASSGIHSNGLSLARKVFQTEEELKSLLKPTRIYVKPILDILNQYPEAITGMSHITGGGWRNLFRLNSTVGFELSETLPLPAVFERLLEYGVSVEEGYKTFNMGMGMALMVSQHAEAIVDQLNAAGFSAKIVGEVTNAAGQIRIPSRNLQLTHVIT